jgi:hypothetical protein
MKYMLLIYEHEPSWLALTEEERQSLYAGYRTLIGELQAKGTYLAGGQLQPTHTATTVRVRNGAIEPTDGPFAETREQLGGYFLIEARDLDEAMAIAARIPTARRGSIEVRPVVAPPASAAPSSAPAVAREAREPARA